MNTKTDFIIEENVLLELTDVELGSVCGGKMFFPFSGPRYNNYNHAAQYTDSHDGYYGSYGTFQNGGGTNTQYGPAYSPSQDNSYNNNIYPLF